MVWPCTCAWQGHARAHGNATRMRVATNRAGILLAIMHPGYQDTTTYAALHIVVLGDKGKRGAAVTDKTCF